MSSMVNPKDTIIIIKVSGTPGARRSYAAVIDHALKTVFEETPMPEGLLGCATHCFEQDAFR